MHKLSFDNLKHLVKIQEKWCTLSSLNLCRSALTLCILSACYMVCVCGSLQVLEVGLEEVHQQHWQHLSPVNQCSFKNPLGAQLLALSSLRDSFGFWLMFWLVLLHPTRWHLHTFPLMHPLTLLNLLITHATVYLSFPLMFLFK